MGNKVILSEIVDKLIQLERQLEESVRVLGERVQRLEQFYDDDEGDE